MAARASQRRRRDCALLVPERQCMHRPTAERQERRYELRQRRHRRRCWRQQQRRGYDRMRPGRRWRRKQQHQHCDGRRRRGWRGWRGHSGRSFGTARRGMCRWARPYLRHPNSRGRPVSCLHRRRHRRSHRRHRCHRRRFRATNWGAAIAAARAVAASSAAARTARADTAAHAELVRRLTAFARDWPQ